MSPTLAAPLAPFADALPVPQRLVAARQNGRLSVPIHAGSHRFHRDLPESAIWGYGGRVPGPTIGAGGGGAGLVARRNDLARPRPVFVTTSPTAAHAHGAPAQGLSAPSSGTP